jgi:2-oxoglutarate dehydrogenase E2 component (dihydrolipoamide succinyltransferase)
MSTEVRVPALPESVADATVLTWHKKPGDAVRKDDNLVDLETDKVVLEVPATASGVLGEIKTPEGDIVQADSLLALIEEGAAEAAQPEAAQPTAPAPAAPATAKAVAGDPVLAPAARRLVKELDLDPAAIPGSGKDGRVQKADVMSFLDSQEKIEPQLEPDATAPAVEQPRLSGEAGRPEQRVTMTRLRSRVAERLVQAQQTAAILTTFNEVDLTAVMGLRKRYRDQFEKTHGVRLGFMSFFVKASVEALQRFPIINASVDGADIIYHGYYDIGMAVSSPRGLVVPILRN